MYNIHDIYIYIDLFNSVSYNIIIYLNTYMITYIHKYSDIHVKSRKYSQGHRISLVLLLNCDKDMCFNGYIFSVYPYIIKL